MFLRVSFIMLKIALRCVALDLLCINMYMKTFNKDKKVDRSFQCKHIGQVSQQLKGYIVTPRLLAFYPDVLNRDVQQYFYAR